MTGIFLIRPLWLLALIPLALVGLWARRAKPAGRWAPIIDPALLPVLRQLGHFAGGRKDRSRVLPVLAAALMVLALAGPARQGVGAPQYQAVDPLILVIDMSPSVVADARVLTEAKAAAQQLMDQAEGRPVGIMLYAADAWLASAPTTDRGALSGLIAVLDRHTVPITGSRPDIALSMARDLFAAPGRSDAGAGGVRDADLVVISDGAGAGPRATEEAARLFHDGARIWALSLPTVAAGAPPPDPAALNQLATAGGGAMFPSAEVQALGVAIARARSARIIRAETASGGAQDYGPWLLPFAMLALLPLYRRVE